MARAQARFRMCNDLDDRMLHAVIRLWPDGPRSTAGDVSDLGYVTYSDGVQIAEIIPYL